MCIYIFHVPCRLNPIISDVVGARRGASEASEPCTSEAACDTGTMEWRQYGQDRQVTRGSGSRTSIGSGSRISNGSGSHISIGSSSRTSLADLQNKH